MEQMTAKRNAKLGTGWGNEAKIVKVSRQYTKVPDTEVLQTTKYDYFKLDNRNRLITEEKVHFFMKQFQQDKFFMIEFPVIVDKDFVILDGQHRFEAVKRLELPLYFRFAKTLTIDNVVDVQINAGWKTNDFLHAFIKQKKQDYIVLHRFINRYKLSTSTAVMLLSGNSNGSLKSTGFYEGTFMVKDEGLAHEQAKVINEIGELALGLHRDRSFCVAMIKIMTHPEYDNKRMADQMTKYSSIMRRHMTIDNYIRNLEEIYNYKLYTKNKVRFV